MEQFGVRDVNEPDQAGNDVEIPQVVRIQRYIPQEWGQKISYKRTRIVGTCRRKVGHIDPSGCDLGVSNAVRLNKEPRDL